VSGIVLRYGLGAESMAWIAIFAVQPISGVYYPIATLPEWLQYLAWALPSSHVFEGMRAVLVDRQFRLDLLLNAIGLNVVYLGAGFSAFLMFFRIARVRGQLLHVGE
jgi:ABC-2 type transport system permease protein